LQNVLPDWATFSKSTGIKSYWPTRTVNKPELHLQFSSYHAVNTHYFHCKDQSVNVVPENSCHLFRSQCKTQYTVQAEHNFGMLNLATHKVTTGHWRLHEAHPYTKLYYNAICLSLLTLYGMSAHMHHTQAFLEL
jgi:hypothetical protein